jgi:hypothetical protein
VTLSPSEEGTPSVGDKERQRAENDGPNAQELRYSVTLELYGASRRGQKMSAIQAAILNHTPWGAGTGQKGLKWARS